jgi:hypothetical protein
MITVNDLMGFEVAGTGWFWQKAVRPPVSARSGN